MSGTGVTHLFLVCNSSGADDTHARLNLHLTTTFARLVPATELGGSVRLLVSDGMRSLLLSPDDLKIRVRKAPVSLCYRLAVWPQGDQIASSRCVTQSDGRASKWRPDTGDADCQLMDAFCCGVRDSQLNQCWETLVKPRREFISVHLETSAWLSVPDAEVRSMDLYDSAGLSEDDRARCRLRRLTKVPTSHDEVRSIIRANLPDLLRAYEVSLR